MIVNAQAGRLPLADTSVDAALCSPPYWGGFVIRYRTIERRTT